MLHEVDGHKAVVAEHMELQTIALRSSKLPDAYIKKCNLLMKQYDVPKF